MNLFERSDVRQALETIDRAGRDASKEDWIDLCDEVASYYETSADAARRELRADEEE